MKFWTLSVLLCTLVATATAQSSAKSQMQNALGSMLSLVREMSLANKDLISNTEDQVALNTAYTALEDLYALLPVFGSENSSALPLPSRTRLNNALGPFQNAIAGWESALDPRTADNLASTFKTVESSFLGLAGVVFSL